MSTQWAPIPDFPNYAISDKGDVWSFPAKRLIKAYVRSRRRSVCLSADGKSKQFVIARLVAAAFVPGRTAERWTVNHIDGNPSNDCAVNLEWASYREQAAHAREHRLHKSGSAHPCSKLSPENVEDIRERYAGGQEQKDIADSYGLCQSTVSSICLGKTRSSEKARNGRRTLSVHEQAQIMADDRDALVVAKEFGVSRTTVYRLRKGSKVEVQMPEPCCSDEKWAAIPGYDGYQVSSCGRIWSAYSNRTLQTAKPNRGIYVHVALSNGERKVHQYVHRLVAAAFCPGRTNIKTVVDHIDQNGVNNHMTNLRWVSQMTNLENR